MIPYKTRKELHGHLLLQEKMALTPNSALRVYSKSICKVYNLDLIPIPPHRFEENRDR
jgi:hypothetical protein